MSTLRLTVPGYQFAFQAEKYEDMERSTIPVREKFSDLVVERFVQLTEKYHSDDITLSAQELFSLIIGISYTNSFGENVKIEPTCYYYRKLKRTIKKRFVCNKSKRYGLNPVFAKEL